MKNTIEQGYRQNENLKNKFDEVFKEWKFLRKGYFFYDTNHVLTKEEALAREQGETLVPELNSRAYEALGIKKLDAIIDLEKSKNFRKEGDLEVQEFFTIVYDKNKKHERLLKYYPNNYLLDDVEFKYEKLSELRSMQGEVFASRVARYLEYPVPETELVEYNGVPCLSYEYFDHAKEWSRFETNHKEGQVSNPKAIWMRPIFNLLIGSKGDYSFQGILDNSNKYYAQDVEYMPRVTEQNFETEIAETVERFGIPNESYAKYNYGVFPDITNEKVLEELKSFLIKIKNIDEKILKEFFVDFMGTENDKEELINSALLQIRFTFRVVEKILDQNSKPLKN